MYRVKADLIPGNEQEFNRLVKTFEKALRIEMAWKSFGLTNVKIIDCQTKEEV